MLLMRSVVRRCHQNVVDVAESEWQASQHLIHRSLEGLARVPQPEWHAHKLKQAKPRHDRRLLHVRCRHRDLMVPLLQI